MDWLPAAMLALKKNDYPQVVDIYETAVEGNPEEILSYFYLGLAYLLVEREEEAQGTWIYALTNCNPEQIDSLSAQLTQILETEAQRQQGLGNLSLAWLVRIHLRELSPQLTNNILNIINLEIQQNQFTPEGLEGWDNWDKLVDQHLLETVLLNLMYYPAQETLKFIRDGLNYVEDLDQLISLSLSVLNTVAYQQKCPAFSAEVIEIFLEKRVKNLVLINQALAFYSEAENLQKSVEMAQKFYNESSILTTKLYGNYLILFALLRWGIWQDAQDFIDRNEQLLQELIQEENPVIQPFVLRGLPIVSAVLPYLADKPLENRRFTNLISGLFYKNFIESYYIPEHPKSQGKLRIGYIAHTLRRHSVGWLSRWLIRYHDLNEFEVGIYLIANTEDEITETEFKPYSSFYRNLGANVEEIVAQIRNDKLDILMDLDSLTCPITYQVLALKPAPIQVTWLGSDASGLPTIDYYLADPYVLPENAQDYYREKIWRLPTTYVAVDGFEVGIATNSRKDLKIPETATIYLSVQSGLKRHPGMIRLQMKILKGVENSYFLIKGVADREKICQLFQQIAREEGVNPERLYFLPQDEDEVTHRANLSLADVVLDTYPYNGATTTLEVLWMEIPIVTKVGQQFSARNSYTFMINAGITEAIAPTDQEYIDWGIRLGKDPELRQEIAWKLRLGKQRAPLWNTRAFTKEVEASYKKMQKINDKKENPD
jgi:predicted O-linked N-acetylglucosamine transferase (SPINDLY family)